MSTLGLGSFSKEPFMTDEKVQTSQDLTRLDGWESLIES